MMSIFNFKTDREKEKKVVINSILNSLESNHNEFSYEEQAFILKEVQRSFISNCENKVDQLNRTLKTIKSK